MAEENGMIETLVAEIKNGNYDRLPQLLKFCAYIPKSAVDNAARLGFDYDDLIQEALLALLGAIHSYDSEGDASFRTFASLCITRRIFDLLRADRKQSNLPMTNYCSIDEANLLSVDNPENCWIEKEDYFEKQKWIFSRLSEYEGSVLKHYLAGLCVKEIGEKFGKSEKSISNALFRIRKKLKPE